MTKVYDFRTKEERLRTALGNLGYKIFTLRGWFGKGFVALDIQFGRMSTLIFRKKGGDFEIQPLDSMNHVREERIIHLRFESKFILDVREIPYNPTKRKLEYRWPWLVLVKERRGHVLLWGGVELKKEEVRKKVGAPRELQREPIPKPLHVMPKKQFWGEPKARLRGAWK